MARQAQHILSFKLNDISANLQNEIIVIKWPEDTRKSSSPHICHLSIDPKGYYLICLDKFTNETECFDIALIHDTRTGASVSLPQGMEDFNHSTFGMLDVPIRSKCVSIYYGNTFVVSNELRVIHFIFKQPMIAQEWAEQLFRIGHNQMLRNLSSLGCLEKIHSKIIHSLINTEKKIPVQTLIQFLCKNNRDFIKETKIYQTLEDLKILNKTGSVIDRDQFTFNKFLNLYWHLMERDEVVKLFDSIGGKHRRYISWENLRGFLKKQTDTQNDPFGLDSYEQKSKDLIRKYNQDNEHSKDKGMYEESFLRYLLSFDNFIIDPTILNLSMDMNKPLSHYFISSSHNTYLSGSQFTGRASVEMYRQVLLTGCRCIELDVVDSGDKNDEPEIKHIHTPIRPIRFMDVIVAIREYAFKVTPYPLILSIENHCGPKAQAKMARCLVDVFRDNLLTEPLSTHPLEENQPLPSPNDLKYKILIKNKKLKSKNATIPQKAARISASSSSEQSVGPTMTMQSNSIDSPDKFNELLKRLSSGKSSLPDNPRHGCLIEDGSDDDDDDKITSVESETKIPESKPIKVLSDLVNYISPARFKSFARCEERNRSHEISSLSEDKAYNLNRDSAKEFLDYNQRQLSRIYPRGTRFDSSNYNPYLFWPIGCQMVALNYQTLDIPMQVNLGLFSLNGACGYVEKPKALCQIRNSFDPKVTTHIENVVSYKLDIKILSGQFLCQDREPKFVDIQMYGMYGDINRRHEYRICAKRWNGFQAIYDETDVESGEFSNRFAKVILPEMAALRFSVTTEDGTFLGQCFLPVAHLRSGYRHITLRNQINIPTNSSSLFVFIQRNIFVNEKDQDLINRLVEPLTSQTSVLTTPVKYDNKTVSNLLVRFHNPFSNESAENSQRQSSLELFDESNSYQKHIIAASELNNRKRLCKILSLNDIAPTEIQKREQTIHNKLRRVSFDHHTRIEKGKVRFQESLNSSTIITKKDLEQGLLRLYSEKFYQQEDLERKQLNEYYKKIEKEIKDDYDRRINQIDDIIKTDKYRVNEYVQSQIKRDLYDIEKRETTKEKISLLKQNINQKYTNIGAVTSGMLEDMYEQVKELLGKNLQINLNQLEEQKTIEIETCFQKYVNQYSELEVQLICQISSNESKDNHHSRLKTSSVPHFPPQIVVVNQQPRRQTINQ